MDPVIHRPGISDYFANVVPYLLKSASVTTILFAAPIADRESSPGGKTHEISRMTDR
jgi:hypothetical protein